MNGRKVVLIVDDDAALREAVIDTLADEGYDVHAATNGSEALDELRRDPLPPCLVLLDLMMPVMNGFEFLTERAHDPSLAKIPVVVISAHGRPADVQADDFLQKPVSLDSLLAVVERYCPAA